MIDAVREFWDLAPCGSDLSSATDGGPAYFNETAAARYRLEPHIKPIAQFDRFRDRDVLEIGCGIGADGACFAAAGARYTGIDLSPASVALTQARFDTLGLAGTILEADAEALPFENSSFDHVYSFGVIHHSPNTEAIVAEMHRVLRPGGTLCVMVYNKSSINYYVEIMGLRRAFRWILVPSWSTAVLAKIGLPRAKLEGHRAALRRKMTHDQWVSMNTDGPDCPLAKVYSASDVQELFLQFCDVRTEVRFFNRSHWLGIGRWLPADWLGDRWGWHRVVYGRES